ncbi:xanthine dehydrogenase family protein molybdopterin-binding subunit [Sphingobacterium sp. N143]|uniref:xanthine dehydrogenase family protein molybdopterin-binding subunit n=1 Tax=Sphingobacterium sp. N143 TaxID=2746727 RepID=UPI002577E77A|nr:molybdopterin cofactor-binding domain-containing protein [Sphingobacterium sp. N143]MDM1296470.1 xanthine dehydrogenase family protein molybdopterin-binding subunit [Sphingobacterium sp. N143]
MKILAPFQKRKTETVNSEIFSVSRRDFLKVGGLLTGGLVLGVSFFSCDDKKKNVVTVAPNIYLSIASDGKVTIIAHRSEMGQGIRTSLPLVVADELGADWKKVAIVQAEGDKKYGDQNTDGSYSVRMFYRPMREAGAIARLLLIRAAAKEWQLPVEECDTENGQVIHRGSNKKKDFGELVETAQSLPIPKVEEIKLKDRKQFNMIGKETAIIDLHDIVTGKAVFGMDAVVEGMKIAVVKRCPVVGGMVKSFDDSKARAVPGVIKVLAIKGAGLPATLSKPLSGVAVIAENTWAAIKGRDLLEVEWDLGPNAAYDSAKQIEQLKLEVAKEGTIRRKRGDFNAAKTNAKKVIDHTYVAPYLAHATIEPPCALAIVKNGSCEVWACTQNPQGARDVVAEALGFAVEKVKMNVTLLGGGFGRKSKPDFIVEAAVLAKETGLPVKVLWTREDDIRHDYYHAMSVQRIVATIDSQNKLSGWAHHIAYPSISATEDLSVLQASDGELMQGATDFPYNVPAINVETHDAQAHLRIGWLRSVRNIPQVFAVATMLDEIAEARGVDAIAQALELLGEDRSITFEQELVKTTYPNYGEKIEDYPWDTGRMKKVIERVAKESGWGKTMPQGSGLGFAAHKSFLTYVACVVEVKVDQNQQVSIPNVYYAVDCGLAVNTDRIKSQFEGGAQFSASLALKSMITVKNGQVEQGNFDGYQIIRMPEAPQQIHVHIMDSDTKPTGVGEPPVPPFTPALCNAIYAATGKRIHTLPIDLKA